MARARASRLGGFAAAVLAGALVAGAAAAGPAGATSTRTTAGHVSPSLINSAGRSISELSGLLITVDVGVRAAAAQAPAGHVGIVISGRGAYCLKWHPGMTGDEVLNAVARVNYRSDGVIVQIDGAPASGTADDTHFWSYWHDTGSRWEYSRIGEGEYTPAPGEVEGWSFDAGDQKPPPPARRPQGLYAALCSAANRADGASSGAAGTSSRAAGTSAAAAAPSGAGSPAPTLFAVGVVALLLASGAWVAARRRRTR